MSSGRSRRFLRLSLGFWSGTTRARAWLLTIAVLVFLVANLAAALAVNLWHKFFFDALEQKDTSSVLLSIGLALILAMLSGAFFVGGLHARMRLQVRWRQWLARSLINRWLADRHFYQLSVLVTEADNPEARIAEDARLAIELLVDLTLGVLNAVLAAVSFISILWVVGGSLTVAGYTIPGYMVFACIIYSAITSLGMFLMGRPLVRRVEEKSAGEAQLRYELTRVRDNAEIIALMGGDENERARLDVTLAELVHRWLRVITWQGRMNWLIGSNLILASTVPLLLGAPKYLADEMTLGSLMQAATAFMQVQVALNWLADNALRLADWFSSSHRVTQLTDAIDRLEESLGSVSQTGNIRSGGSPDDRLHLRQLKIALRDGELIVDGADAVIAPGEKVLIKAEGGTEKSAFIHAVAGLWPWGSGEILRPQRANITFISHRPYLPLGTLRTALLYPDEGHEVSEERIRDALTRCGLRHLIPRLDDTDQWTSLLSSSEQQRFAFARALIQPPDILIMDEPTSALDELSQLKLMEYMRDLLPGTMVIHAGHGTGLEQFHDRELVLVRSYREVPAARGTASRDALSKR